MRSINSIVIILVIIGALSLGLFGAFDFNLVNAIFGSVPLLERIVYILGGLSAVFVLVNDSKHVFDFNDGIK